MAKGAARTAISAPEALPTPTTPTDATAPNLPTLKRYFADYRDLTQAARSNALMAIDYYDTDQYTADELKKLSDRNQPPLQINRIKPAINGMIGITERGRSDPHCWPRNPGDEDTADAATDILRYIADQTRFMGIKRDCFKDMLVPGTMAALTGVDQDKQVTITQIRWEEFFADPRARRADFKDARYLGIAKYMYADDVSALYPDKASEIEATVNSGGVFAPDQSFQDRPLGQMSLGSPWIDTKQRRLMVIELYYREGGWKRAVFTAMDILEHGPSPYTDHKGAPDCPIEAQSAYVKRDNSRYGVVWDMIGPQDEVNKRRSSALHRLVAKQVEVADPMALETDVKVARQEAAKPDGVLPPGYKFADNRADVSGHLEMLQEAKSEIDRMALPAAMSGRSDDSSARHLLARQQSGLVELAPIYGALEDWELRIYRQCWARAKQFWRAPQWIRVTDDENAPKFVGLNMAMTHPETGAVLGYQNPVGEMDIDIEIDSQPDVGSIQQEQFEQIVELVKLSPVYQQQIGMKQLIQLSTIPHKRAILDQLEAAAQQQAAAARQQGQLATALTTAKIEETQARTAELAAKPALHAATGFAKASDALTYAHQAHSETAVAGLEKGLDAGAADQAQQAAAQGQASDQAHQAAMQTSQQAAAANEAQADQAA